MKMSRFVWIVASAALAVPSAAAPIPPQQAPRVIQVTMTNYRFTPDSLSFQRGVPVVLRIINSQGSHNFVAPELFAASSVAPADRAYIRRGAIEVLDDETVDIHFTPNVAGHYHIACTHFLHEMYGMVGEAIVA